MLKTYFSISCLLLHFNGYSFAIAAFTTQPERQLRFGTVKGFWSDELGDGRRAQIYLGIPYAEPPLNELRFEKPVQWSKNFAQPLNATAFGPSCVPLLTAPDQQVSEDCLTLNVFTPEKESADPAGYPVLVYVHGGGFGYGCSEYYGYKNLTENFVTQDLVVVVLQYRLAVFGFATDDTKDLPGNLGMFDQALAFKWIYENIGPFGGDPERITAWGLSAGGASVGHLELSPHSRNYIKQTIIMSGVPTNPWAFQLQNFVKIYTGEVIEHLGCTDSSWKTCLLAASTKEIQAASAKVARPISRIELLQFIPVFDHDFFPDTPEKLFDQIPADQRKPALIGVTEIEALYFSILNKDLPLNNINVPKEEQPTFGLSELKKFVKKFLAIERRVHDKMDLVEREILNFYTKDQDQIEDEEVRTNYYLHKFTELASDVYFLVGALQYAELRASHDWTTYLYITNHYNPAQFPENTLVKGATHANEYPYMNGAFPVGQFDFDENDYKHQRIVVDMIASFAKTGKTSGEWAPVEPGRLRHAILNTNVTFIDDTLAHERLQFWNQLFKKVGVDIISLKETGEKPREEL